MDVNEFHCKSNELGYKFSSGEEKIKTRKINNHREKKEKWLHTILALSVSPLHPILSFINSTSICAVLSSLEDFYSCVDYVLQAPHSQHNLTNEKWVDEALDGYLGLLDVCVNTKDIFSQTKEDVQQLLSSIRRNKDSSIFQGYIASRKKTIKVIRKLLKDLKSIESKNLVLDSDQDESISMLKVAQGVTVSVLESLLSHVAGTKAYSQSLISKLLHQKNGTKEVISEFEQIDVAINSFKNTETLQNQIQKSELSIENVEEALERLIRHLIKTRVSLLNILNH